MPKQTKKGKSPERATKKPKSIAKLVEAAAVLLQKLVRMKAADSNGNCKCVTCGKVDHWKNMQGGHFIERGRKATILIEENCHPQDAGCNMYRMKTASGVLAYQDWMIDHYGIDFVADLKVLSGTVKKFTRQEVEEITKEFQEQIRIQQERLA